MDMTQLSLRVVVALFVGAAVLIGLFGARLSREADRLAEATGMGQALMGGVFLGCVTSIAGTITSVTAAADGHADLAVNNAVGGIAVQTVFLAVADMAYRRANLEHAASSLPNMLQGALLICLLTLPLLALTGPSVSWLGVHPLSVLLMPAYVLGMRLVSHVQKVPLWKPHLTAETKEDKVVAPHRSPHRTRGLWIWFVTIGIIVGGAGFVVAHTGVDLSAKTGISESLVGAFLTAISTSLPELITSVAAVRQGALTLAVGGIIGGNCFDVLFLSFSDIAYREGSIYHAIDQPHMIHILALTILLTGILLMGLLRRETHGIANIGFESVLIVIVYLGAFTLLALRG